MKEMMQFPAVHTFKIVGDAQQAFVDAVASVFHGRPVRTMADTSSRNGTFISFSVTVDVATWEELTEYYRQIAVLPGLRFHV